MPLNSPLSPPGRGAESGPTGASRPERLRLGVHLLPEPDVKLVRAFVQMSGTFIENFPWVFAEEPPFDLVLTDAVSAQRRNGSAGRPAEAMLLITDGNAHSPDMMQRPLRYRILEDWLKQRGAEIRADRLHRPKQPDPPPAAPAPVATPLDSGDPYVGKLERWPPSAFLHQDRLHLRIATLLTANGMKLSDLIRLCREPEDEVRAGLRAFLDAGLVRVEPARRLSPPAAAGPGPVVPQAPSRPKAGLGLIASIRRRLGL